MLKKHLYLQICSIVIASLLGFAVLATLAWTVIGHDQADSDLFVKSAALSEMLIPSIDRDLDAQQAALDKLHQALDFDVALYDATGTLLAHAGAHVELPQLVNTITVNAWHASHGKTHWTTKLQDGRYLAINLSRIALPGESTVFTLFLAIITVSIAIIMYPFIRHVTRRLERLQLSVRQIGLGQLDARVKVEGEDEVAQLAISFNEAAARIQSLVNAQQLLLANASHELRTPLARIRLGIDMLNKKNTPDRLAALQVDIVELDTLIEEITMMTRIDAGVSTREFEQFDLMGLIAEECARYSDCECTGNSILMTGDRRMVQRALRNLVDNGLKHGKPPVRVCLRSDGQKITLSVSDEGNGIESRNQARLFEPFQRGKGKQNVVGSGLGLALVKKITAAHHGSVIVKNKPKSTVSLIFPS